MSVLTLCARCGADITEAPCEDCREAHCTLRPERSHLHDVAMAAGALAAADGRMAIAEALRLAADSLRRRPS